ncbi:MAG: peptidoglycan endopeptidase [Parasphingorhabdus sp.]
MSSNQAETIAEMAMQLCGSDFRLHGRSADHGLDCIGLAAQCLAAADIPCEVPTGYSVRGGSAEQIVAVMEQVGFTGLPNDRPLHEGDIVLARPSPVQWHLMVRAEGGFVHAHAGLGQVVFTPGPAPWPIAKIFRLES